jgi:hypothetical protein
LSQKMIDDVFIRSFLSGLTRLDRPSARQQLDGARPSHNTKDFSSIGNPSERVEFDVSSTLLLQSCLCFVQLETCVMRDLVFQCFDEHRSRTNSRFGIDGTCPMCSLEFLSCSCPSIDQSSRMTSVLVTVSRLENSRVHRLECT